MNEIRLSSEDAKTINKKLLKCLDEYKKIIFKMSYDLPIEILNIKCKTKKLLRNKKIARVYEILDLNLTEIEWLDDVTRRDLTSALNQLFPM